MDALADGSCRVMVDRGGAIEMRHGFDGHDRFAVESFGYTIMSSPVYTADRTTGCTRTSGSAQGGIDHVSQ
jgi:hypothetical protein